MNQQERFDAIRERIGQAMALEPVDIPPELERPNAFLKVMDAMHYNWAAERFEKIFGMRMAMKVPPLQQLNYILYPKTQYDTPIFIFFCLVTRRKIIAHLNVNCPFDDASYRARYIEPLADRLARYPSFETKDRYPQWMKKYRNETTIYGMYPGDRAEDITDCMFDYLDFYLESYKRDEPLGDLADRTTVERFHDQFRSDIRTQDKAQGMMAKLIGKDTAKRIFYEVST